MKHLLVFPILAFVLSAVPLQLRAQAPAEAGGLKVIKDVAYKSGPELTDDEKQSCKLDLYLPADKKGFATLVWFHGGGLIEGDKKGDAKIARSFVKGGVAFVTANYRLSPKSKFPSYIEDAAAAVAWTRAHIAGHGGDPAKVFIGGHSAGGYLSLIVGLDERYLRAQGVSPADIAGLVPVSGQTMTHYTIREERGGSKFSVIADEAAPVFYGRKDTPPMLVLYADRDMAARAEENEFFVALMKGAGNKRVTGRMIADRNHGSISSRIADEADPARLAILEFIQNPAGTSAEAAAK